MNELLVAVGVNDRDAAEAALASGAKIDGVLQKGFSHPKAGYIYAGSTPLYHAGRKGRLRMIDWLLSKGADIDGACFQQETPLLALCRQGAALKSVLRILKHGPDLNVQNPDQETPLHFAVNREKLKVVQALLDAGARVDIGKADENYGVDGKPTYTPLYRAAVSGLTEISVVLLKAGADPNTGTADRWLINPLGMAIKNEDKVLITALLAHGAKTEDPYLSEDLRTRLARLAP
ncbi:MAG: ankyrin repeat domain-containing protein [Myxococcota bacterium]